MFVLVFASGMLQWLCFSCKRGSFQQIQPFVLGPEKYKIAVKLD